MDIVLVPIPNPTNKRAKYKTYTPITLGLTPMQRKLIKDPPHTSLRRCREGIGDPTDWYNIAFRVMSAYNISLEVYEKVTQDSLKEVVDLLLTIKDRHTPEKFWFVSSEELDMVESGIEAMDTMGEQTLRRTQVEAMIKTKAYLQQFL